jgi:hypothetical protein
MDHVLCGLILLTRIGDVVSTRLASPTMRLEANPVMRRFGWKLALLSVLACFIPYYSTILGVLAFVMFAFVCYSNFSHTWLLRALGEERYEALLLEAAAKTTLAQALVPMYAGLGFLALVGVFGMALTRGSEDWSFWASAGWVFTAAGTGFHLTTYQVRLHRRARADAAREV